MEQVITAQNIQEAAAAVRAACPQAQPEVAIILGSGLNGLAKAIDDPTFISYQDVPHMAPSTAPLHEGRFVVGTLSGKQVICMQGRIHAYEGYSAQQIAFPVYLMAELGCKALIVTNAAGGINASFGVGDLMLITDHINFQFMNPCIGQEEDLGPRFFDMTYPYSRRLQAAAKEAAQKEGIQLQQGVYLGDLGPSFETPAEIRAFRALGADAVGMSTVQEVIAANHLGLEVMGVTLVSNPAAGVVDEPLSMEDVGIAAEKAANRMEALVARVVAEAF